MAYIIAHSVEQELERLFAPEHISRVRSLLSEHIYHKPERQTDLRQSREFVVRPSRAPTSKVIPTAFPRTFTGLFGHPQHFHKHLMPKPRNLFRAQLIALSFLSLWRIVICFWEYDAGPFVSVPRTLLDQAPFWALSSLLPAFAGWYRATAHASRLLVVGGAVLAVSTADLVIFNGTARETLYTGSWAGSAYVSFEQDAPWSEIPTLCVTFTPDQQVVFLLGTKMVPIYRGEWRMTFNPIRCSQSLSFGGLARGEYWNKEDLYVRGSFNVGNHSYQLSAQLRHVRKRSA
jgi:hypothetical protein